MCPIAATSVCLAALSLPAAPMPKNAVLASLGRAPVLELVTQGCSAGWHRGLGRTLQANGTGATAFRAGADYSTDTDFAQATISTDLPQAATPRIVFAIVMAPASWGDCAGTLLTTQ